MPTRIPIANGHFIDLDALTIRAEPVTGVGGVQLWAFWCVYCKTQRVYGRGDGHRDGYCTRPESRCDATGYNLSAG